MEFIHRWTPHFRPKSTRRNVKLNKFAFETPWLPDLLCKHWFTSSVWNFCRWVADVPPRKTSLSGDEREETSAVRRLLRSPTGIFAFPLPSSPLDQGPVHRLPRTSVGAFHLAYMSRFLRLTKWWRCQSELEGIDSMSQIKGDITGRTSKERYEQLILEL